MERDEAFLLHITTIITLPFNQLHQRSWRKTELSALSSLSQSMEMDFFLLEGRETGFHLLSTHKSDTHFLKHSRTRRAQINQRRLLLKKTSGIGRAKHWSSGLFPAVEELYIPQPTVNPIKRTSAGVEQQVLNVINRNGDVTRTYKTGPVGAGIPKT